MFYVDYGLDTDGWAPGLVSFVLYLFVCLFMYVYLRECVSVGACVEAGG